MANRITEGLSRLVLKPAIYGSLAYVTTDDAYELMSRLHEPVQRLSEDGIGFIQGLMGILYTSTVMGYGLYKMAEKRESEREPVSTDNQ